MFSMFDGQEAGFMGGGAHLICLFQDLDSKHDCNDKISKAFESTTESAGTVVMCYVFAMARFGNGGKDAAPVFGPSCKKVLSAPMDAVAKQVKGMTELLSSRIEVLVGHIIKFVSTIVDFVVATVKGTIGMALALADFPPPALPQMGFRTIANKMLDGAQAQLGVAMANESYWALKMEEFAHSSGFSMRDVYEAGVFVGDPADVVPMRELHAGWTQAKAATDVVRMMIGERQSSVTTTTGETPDASCDESCVPSGSIPGPFEEMGAKLTSLQTSLSSGMESLLAPLPPLPGLDTAPPLGPGSFSLPPFPSMGTEEQAEQLSALEDEQGPGATASVAEQLAAREALDEAASNSLGESALAEDGNKPGTQAQPTGDSGATGGGAPSLGLPQGQPRADREAAEQAAAKAAGTRPDSPGSDSRSGSQEASSGSGAGSTDRDSDYRSNSVAEGSSSVAGVSNSVARRASSAAADRVAESVLSPSSSTDQSSGVAAGTSAGQPPTSVILTSSFIQLESMARFGGPLQVLVKEAKDSGLADPQLQFAVTNLINQEMVDIGFAKDGIKHATLVCARTMQPDVCKSVPVKTAMLAQRVASIGMAKVEELRLIVSNQIAAAQKLGVATASCISNYAVQLPLSLQARAKVIAAKVMMDRQKAKRTLDESLATMTEASTTVASDTKGLIDVHLAAVAIAKDGVASANKHVHAVQDELNLIPQGLPAAVEEQRDRQQFLRAQMAENGARIAEISFNPKPDEKERIERAGLVAAMKNDKVLLQQAVSKEIDLTIKQDAEPRLLKSLKLAQAGVKAAKIKLDTEQLATKLASELGGTRLLSVAVPQDGSCLGIFLLLPKGVAALFDNEKDCGFMAPICPIENPFGIRIPSMEKAFELAFHAATPGFDGTVASSADDFEDSFLQTIARSRRTGSATVEADGLAAGFDQLDHAQTIQAAAGLLREQLQPPSVPTALVAPGAVEIEPLSHTAARLGVDPGRVATVFASHMFPDMSLLEFETHALLGDGIAHARSGRSLLPLARASGPNVFGGVGPLTEASAAKLALDANQTVPANTSLMTNATLEALPSARPIIRPVFAASARQQSATIADPRGAQLDHMYHPEVDMWRPGGAAPDDALHEWHPPAGFVPNPSPVQQLPGQRGRDKASMILAADMAPSPSASPSPSPSPFVFNATGNITRPSKPKVQQPNLAISDPAPGMDVDVLTGAGWMKGTILGVTNAEKGWFMGLDVLPAGAPLERMVPLMRIRKHAVPTCIPIRIGLILPPGTHIAGIVNPAMALALGLASMAMSPDPVNQPFQVTIGFFFITPAWFKQGGGSTCSCPCPLPMYRKLGLGSCIMMAHQLQAETLADKALQDAQATIGQADKSFYGAKGKFDAAFKEFIPIPPPVVLP
jgi:hypothetical protein